MRTYHPVLPTPAGSSAESSVDETAIAAPEAASAAAKPQRRAHLRFDKVFRVLVESPLFGQLTCVARNVSAGGMFVETSDPLPLGSSVRVRFPLPDGTGDVVAMGEVKNHYFINFAQDGHSRSVSGMAMRFTGFESDSHEVLEQCLGRLRVLH